MPELKIGIQLAGLRLPLKKALHTAAVLGAQAVEIDARNELRPQEISRSGMRQLRKMLDDHNLRVCAVSFRTRRGYDVPDDLDRRLEASKRALRFAYDLGAPVVVNRVGRVPTEPTDAEWDLLVETLTELGEYGQRVGATLAAETGSEEGADLARLLEALLPGSLGVNFDPGNLIVNGFSPSAALEALGEHVLHVHATDGTHDLARRRGVDTPLGRGSVDFPEIMGELEEHAYRGYFTIARDNAQDPIRELGSAVQYLRSF